MKLSIIIPAYNESSVIFDTLNKYYLFFTKKLQKDFELIVVSNNCSDKTFEISSSFSQDKDNVIVFNIPNYCGKGKSVMEGFRLAKGEMVGFTDADNSTNPENFYKLYSKIGNHDGIIASRRKKGARIIPSRAFHKELSSRIFNELTNLLFNLGFADTQCGAKIFTKEAKSVLLKNYSETGWIFDVDLLYICKKKGLKIMEIPITWTDSDRKSKLTLWDKIKSLYSLFKYKFKK